MTLQLTLTLNHGNVSLNPASSTRHFSAQDCPALWKFVRCMSSLIAHGVKTRIWFYLYFPIKMCGSCWYMRRTKRLLSRQKVSGENSSFCLQIGRLYHASWTTYTQTMSSMFMYEMIFVSSVLCGGNCFACSLTGIISATHSTTLQTCYRWGGFWKVAS